MTDQRALEIVINLAKKNRPIITSQEREAIARMEDIQLDTGGIPGDQQHLIAYQAVEKMHGKLLACASFPNPKDSHLSKVLCHTAENEYVVWTFNSQDGGFHTGYYHRDLSNGLERFRDELIKLGYD